MIKSVFLKYILVFLLIITIGFTILATVISSTVVRNSTNAKKISMANVANIARQNIETRFNGSSLDLFNDYINSEKNNISKELSEYIELTGDSFILIADLEGNIIVTTPLPDDYLKEKQISEKIIYDVLNQYDIYSYQTLDGVFSGSHLVFPQLLTYENGEACGVLFLCSVSVWERSFVTQIITAIILNCLWVLVASMVILYFITEKIISPVRTMSKAAKNFALGRFDVKVPVKVSKDEIGELASAFNNMAASLAANEETQRNFLANVSHDLRTPLTSISGFVNSILDGTIPRDQQEEYLKIVSAETDRLSRLVSNLFEITKIQAGVKKSKKKIFDICESARIVIISLGHKIDEKHIEIEFNCEDEKMHVFADPDDIQQVLQNLIENAIKFTSEKGLVKINIINGGKDKEKDKTKEKKIYISVYNTGTGIPAEDIPFVFDRFYKSDRSRGLDKTGAGLGLSIVKTILDIHEEKIWVNAEYEKYCEFTFTLQKIQETKR
ncbi:MAG: HAMP domain-containing histidine kinase [Oscillospiraceae bacterium]|nr:HAMP domain-containing histidine kinase [Oscillospiraceae bacterium]